jgi:hydroxypyruvate isomerase
MKRSTFIKNSLVAGSAMLSGFSFPKPLESPAKVKPFTMKFSPEFGIFKELGGRDVVDQIKWGYDQGFKAYENTGLMGRTVAEQERISKTIQGLGMEFGQFVGTKTFQDVTFAGKDQSLREGVLNDIRKSVEVAKRMNTKFVHNVLGMADPKLPWDFQMANAMDLLKRISDIYEPHGLIMVMETMNHKISHPGMFLHNIPQAYALAKAVARPNVKILFDFFHVQIQEGNLLPTLDYAWDEISYIQIGDAPTRKEPTSGEINYKNVLQHLHNKGYRGFVGMEHGISKPGRDGELAALAAYRSIDPS